MVCTKKKWYIIKIMYIAAKFLMSVALVNLLHLWNKSDIKSMADTEAHSSET